MECTMLSDSAPRRPDVALRSAAVLFAFGLAIHTADHLRRGVDVITGQVFWGGMVLTTTSVIAIALVLTAIAPHRSSPRSWASSPPSGCRPHTCCRRGAR
jgi:hypothetical protein